MMRVRLALAVFAVLATAPVAMAAAGRQASEVEAGAPAATRPTTVRALPARVVDAAIAPESGMVAVVDANEKASFYGSLVAGPVAARVAEVGPRAAAVRFKRVGDKAYFLVLCAGDHTLHVLDAASLKTVKALALQPDACCIAAPADPFVPYAYYAIGARDVTVARKPIGRVNLNTFTTEQVSVDVGVDVIEVSGNGEYLYGTRSDSSPAGIRIFTLPRGGPTDGKLKAALVADAHMTPEGYVQDPLGLYIGTGKTLRSLDFKDAKASLAGRPVAFFADRPLFVTIAGNDLRLLSYNSFKDLAKVALSFEPETRPGITPNPAFAPRPRPGRLGGLGDAIVLADQKNNAVLAFRGAEVAVVELSRLNLPTEPFLYASVATPILTVAQPTTIPFQRRDAKVTVKLCQGPSGMKVEGSALVWTPGDADVGRKKAVLTLSSGPASREQTVELTVRRAGVELPFRIDKVAFACDGRAAVVLARPEPGSKQDPHGQDRPVIPSRLVVIDLEKMAIVADRTLPISVNAVAIDSKYVYATAQDADVLHALERKDLGDAKRIFTKGRPSSVRTVADKYVFVATHQQEERTQIYGAGTLEPADLGYMQTGSFYENRGNVSPQATGPNWYYRGILWAEDFSKPLWMRTSAGLLTVGGAGRPATILPSENRSPTIALWDTIINGTAITRLSGQVTGRIPAGPQAILSELPAAVALTQKRQTYEGDSRPSVRTELVFCDLVAGKAQDTFVLADEPASRYAGDEIRPPHYLYDLRGRVVAVLEDRLFAVKTAELDRKKYVTPLHFEVPGGVTAVKAGDTATMQVAAEGGKGPLEFGLGGDAPGFSIDKKTGKITIDTATTSKAVTATLAEHFQYVASNAPRLANQQPAVAEHAEAYRKQVSGWYRRLTGKDSAGYVVTFPVVVVAQDAEQQTVTQCQYVLLEVSAEGVNQAIAQREEQMRQERERIQAQHRGAVANAQDAAALKQRVADLERENQELKAQIKVLKELIGGKGGKANPEDEGDAPKPKGGRL